MKCDLETSFLCRMFQNARQANLFQSTSARHSEYLWDTVIARAMGARIAGRGVGWWYIARIRRALIVAGYVRRRPRRCRCAAASQRTALTRARLPPLPAPPARRAPPRTPLAAAETSSCEIGSRAPSHLTYTSARLARPLTCDDSLQ